MATALKPLGQSNPSATTNTDFYTVPVATQTVVSNLFVCNRSSSATSFRVAVRPAGATISNEHYVYYDAAIAGNETLRLLQGATLEATDVVTVYATDATLSFNLFGQELT